MGVVFRWGGRVFRDSWCSDTLLMRRVDGPTRLSIEGLVARAGRVLGKEDAATEENETRVVLRRTRAGRTIGMDPNGAFSQRLWPDFRAMYDEWHRLVRLAGVWLRDLADLVYDYAFGTAEQWNVG